MNEMKYPTTERHSPLRNDFKIFQQTTNRDNIHETFGGLLTLYLNSHAVAGRIVITVGQDNFVLSTLRSVQCKDCNFCSCSIDVFLNATPVTT